MFKWQSKFSIGNKTTNDNAGLVSIFHANLKYFKKKEAGTF